MPLQNDNRLSEYSSNLSNWIQGDFLIYIKNDKQIINITSNEKEFDDLNMDEFEMPDDEEQILSQKSTNKLND
mgnify:CR=1 FL=1